MRVPSQAHVAKRFVYRSLRQREQPVTNELPLDRTFLTASGRRLLEAHVRELERTIADLQTALDDRESTRDIVSDYQRVAQEIRHLRAVLQSAGTLGDAPDDPHVVELGDTVTIRFDDGDVESYTIVHAIEARLDDTRISAESPLAHAVLGRRTGERVAVATPSGSYECTITHATRS